MNSLVSVIVPSYNVESFLPRCINSLLAQTYLNLEIIIVDDGAADRTGEIGDEYAAKNPNVYCIHKENGGLSDARNAGLRVAQGEYVVFFDSDDWVEPKTIEDNLQLMIEKDVPVIVWGYYADFVDESETVRSTTHHCCTDVLCLKGENPEVLFQEDRLGLVGYAWNKMYRMDLLKQGDFTFTRGLSLVEDIVFNVPVLIAAERVYFNSRKYTHYMQRGRVTLGNRYYDNFLDLKLLACDKRKELLSAYGVDGSICEDALWKNYLFGYISTIRMINRKNDIRKSQKQEMIRFVVNRWLQSSQSKKAHSKDKKVLVLYWLLRLRMYGALLRIIK